MFGRGPSFAVLRVVLAALCLAWLALPDQARAQSLDFAETGLADPCIAAIDADADLAASRGALDWTCQDADLAAAAQMPRAVMRFALDQATRAGDQPYFAVRRSPFGSLELLVVDDDGETRSVAYRYDEMQPSTIDGTVQARLPTLNADSRNVYAAIDAPTNPLTLSTAAIRTHSDAAETQAEGMLLVMSFLCGMLVMPLLFSPTFYRVLRRSFVLWHTLLGLALLAAIVLESGLSGFFVALPPSQLDHAITLAMGIAVASAAMFARGFIEEDALHPIFRTLLAVGAGWAILVSAAQAFAPAEYRVWSRDFYYWAYLPVLWLFVTVLVDALLRGSRSAKYQLIGWAPLLLAGAMRLISQLTDLVPPTDVLALFYVGCVVQMLATTMGVVDAFMSLRHQRDDAVSEAIEIEKKSERDALTGLFNRGYLEANFDRLHADGFTSLAVVDLDFFKHINDTYGHATGDEVLRAVSRALERKLDVDTVAVRMGGEEFVLLLRGANAAERADRRRRQIPRAVADLVELQRPVTASMGLVVSPEAGSAVADFDALYAFADKLLYRAKEGGRNRLVSEKLSALGEARREAA